MFWHAKVHKSGKKVAVFNGSKLVKVVESSKETFEQAEAQKFAEELVNELHQRTLTQMTDTQQEPSVSTESELQNASMTAINQQATGKGADDKKTEQVELSDSNESESNEEPEEIVSEDVFANKNKKLLSVIANLKNKLANERSERITERKARRGLAIAKQLVVEGKLEDSYNEIKSKVAEIVKLEDSEIDRLERKVAGEHEFVSIDEAQKELRRQTRIARINRQAAAEAQEDLDEEQADSLDNKADEAEAKASHIQQVIEDMNKVSTETEESEVKKAAEETTEEPEVKETTEEPEAKETVEEPEVKKAAEEPEVKETEESEVEKEPEVEKEQDKEKLSALIRKYHSIAINHRKLAEKAESEGDIETADKQDELADAADENAEEIKNKLAECSTEEKSDDAEEKSDSEEKTDDTEEKSDDVDTDDVKTSTIVTASSHKTIKRDGESIEGSFGIDKNASLVEQNDFSNDPEVEILSKMWRSSPRDEE
jgi:hypothetical protein